MITLTFVHGTGVRKQGYDDTLAVIREQVARWPDVRVAECRWGEAHGCQLHADGAAVPTYDSARALGDQLTPQQAEKALWGLLLRDPLGELRLLAVREGEPEETPAWRIAERQTRRASHRLRPGTGLPKDRFETHLPTPGCSTCSTRHGVRS